MASKRVVTIASRHLRTSTTLIPTSPPKLHFPRNPSTTIHTITQTPRSIRLLSTTPTLHKDLPSATSPSAPQSPPLPKIYTFPTILSLSTHPTPTTLLIDVREPSELLSTGTIPSSVNVPITSSPDAFYLPASEFEDKHGFPRPGKDVEVIFFCKSGVRSKAAARLAQNAGFGGQVGEFPGSWREWSEKGGGVERVGG